MRNLKLFLLFFEIIEILCSFDETNFISKDTNSNSNGISFDKDGNAHGNIKTDNNGPFISYTEQGGITMEKRELNFYFWLFLTMFLAAVVTAVLFTCFNSCCLKKPTIQEKKKEKYGNI